MTDPLTTPDVRNKLTPLNKYISDYIKSFEQYLLQESKNIVKDNDVKITVDGDQWSVLLGENIQEGVCGFGDTLDEAMTAFMKDFVGWNVKPLDTDTEIEKGIPELKPVRNTLKTGVQLIDQERNEQIHKYGRTTLFDYHNNPDRVIVHACISILGYSVNAPGNPPNGWDPVTWSNIVNKSHVQRLAIVGAFVAAEIDRCLYVKHFTSENAEG